MAVTEGTILRIVASLVFPDNVIMQNIFHAVLTSAGGSDAEDDVVDDMVDYLEDIYTDVISRISEDVVSDEVKVYEYDSTDDDFDEVGTSSFSVTFTAPDEWLPHGLAVVCNSETTNPDVSGRKYFGGLAEPHQADGEWTSTTVTAFAAAMLTAQTQFVGAATGATFTPGVWSPTRTTLFPSNGVVSANSIPGYQRRRKPGVGI